MKFNVFFINLLLNKTLFMVLFIVLLFFINKFEETFVLLEELTESMKFVKFI